jgi:small-conductance mechanosensitive channel
MEKYINKIPYLFIVTYTLVGILLFFGIKIINANVIPLLKEKQHSVGKSWQRLKITLWIIYFVLFYATLFQANMFITSIFTLIILGLGWNYWRNIFSGTLIKFNNQFKPGDRITSEFASGTLKNIYFDETELINDEGELVIIPNHKLNTAVLKHHFKKDSVETHLFKIKTNNKSNVDTIYRNAINCPYISANQEIIITKKGDNKYTIKASIIDNSFIEKTQEFFKNLESKK